MSVETSPEKSSLARRLIYLGVTAVALGVGIITGNQLLEIDSPVVAAIGGAALAGGLMSTTFGVMGEGLAEARKTH